MKKQREKKYNAITLSSDLKDKILNLIDPAYRISILRESSSYSIYNWVGLIGSAQRIMDDKLKLLWELKTADMGEDTADYLFKGIAHVEKAMDALYKMDPDATLVCNPPSSSRELIPLNHMRDYYSFQKMMQYTRIRDAGGMPEDEDNNRSSLFRLRLYDAAEEEAYIYFCDREGEVQYFRNCRDLVEMRLNDPDLLLLNDVFCGIEGIGTWVTPYWWHWKKKTG